MISRHSLVLSKPYHFTNLLPEPMREIGAHIRRKWCANERGEHFASDILTNGGGGDL